MTLIEETAVLMLEELEAEVDAKAEQITELTTKLSRYEAIMADAWNIDIADGLSLFRSPDNTWSLYDSREFKSGDYPSPLEAFEALQKERV